MKILLKKNAILNPRVAVRGVTLVELMVAVAIGLVLIAAMTYSYSGTRAAFRAQEAQSRKLENGRVALETIVRDIRLAGRLACQRTNGELAYAASVSIAATFPVMEATATAFQAKGLIRASAVDRFINQSARTHPELPTGSVLNPSSVVRAFDHTEFTPPLGSIYSSPRSGTQALQIIKTSESGSSIKTAMTLPTSNIHLSEPISGARPGTSQQLFVISDCERAEILRAQVNTSIIAAGGKLDYDGGLNAVPALLHAYGASAFVSQFDPVTYMIANPPASAQVDTPYLVRYDIARSNSSTTASGQWGRQATIIADGIEDLQIRFGVSSGDGRGIADSYVAAKDVADWDLVVSVEVSLVAISKENRVAVTSSTATDGSSDSRFRQRLSSIVQLRNRLPL